jgi:hypothetical protein
MGLQTASDLQPYLTYADAEWVAEMPTPGSWFYLDLGCYEARNEAMREFFETTNIGKTSVAYHGTSLSCATLIVSGGFRCGPNITAQHRGVYMEGTVHKLSTYNYITHEHVALLPHVSPLHQFGAVFELIADRSKGRSIHGQWVQPLKSFYLDGLYLHAFDLFSLYEANHMGWFRCHIPSLEHLAVTTDMKELKSSWEIQDELYEEAKARRELEAAAADAPFQ